MATTATSAASASTARKPSGQTKQLPAPKNDFYQLARVLTADEKAIVKKERFLGALRAGTKEAMKGTAMTEAATGWPADHRHSSNEIADVSTLVAELLANATEALDRDRETARRCIAHAAAVVERIGRCPQPGESATSQGGLAPWQVRRLRTYIDANLSARITLNELSEVARLSTSHFSRAFKRRFGMAPYAFVLRRRMEYAQRLMLTSESPLCQIALECGLSDQSHFSRLFQRTMGTSPNEWRRFSRVDRQAASVS